jgi:hypothetical protein
MSDASPALESLRRLQLVWGVVVVLVLVATIALVALAAGRSGTPPAAAWAGPVFYGNALINLGAHLLALATLRRLPLLVATTPTAEAAVDETRRVGLPALAALQMAAFLAVGAAYLTAEWVNLAFLVPFIGLAALYFPSRGRVARWRAG